MAARRVDRRTYNLFPLALRSRIASNRSPYPISITDPSRLAQVVQHNCDQHQFRASAQVLNFVERP